MRYIVETADRRAPGYFVRDTGDRKWEFKPERQRAMKMDLATAKRFVEILAMKNVIARVCDECGNPQTDYVYATQVAEELTLHNLHETFSFRHRGHEMNIVHNKALSRAGRPGYFFKFTNHPTDPAAPFDQSVAGSSAEDAIDRFLDNPHIPDAIKQRFRVDETLPEPEKSTAVPPGTPTVTVPIGFEVVGWRPGNNR